MESDREPKRMSFPGNYNFLTGRSNMLSYGLLALCYILVVSLFVIILSHNNNSSHELASKKDLQSLNSDVDELLTKMKQVRSTKKASTGCETDWEKFKGSCYLIMSSKSNWIKARSLCIQKHSDLVVINNDEEQKFLKGKTVDTQYWIGLNDMEEEGKWTWVDNSDYSSSYKSWLPDKPTNNNERDDCAYLSTQWNWNNGQCFHDQYSAICEKKM